MAKNYDFVLGSEPEKNNSTYKKKFVRYEEGAKMYSMGITSFRQLAKEANAVYHFRKIVLINTEVIDEFLEAFRDEY